MTSKEAILAAMTSLSSPFEDAKRLQLEGNALYGRGRYVDARASYSSALALLEALPTSTLASADVKPAIAQLLSNRAQTFIQERDFAAALHGTWYTNRACTACACVSEPLCPHPMHCGSDCAKALKHDPANEKAALRRLVALENLERFEAASTLVDAALTHRGVSEHAPALFQYAVAARHRLRKTLARDGAAAKSEVAQLGKMVHENQQLRINFGYACVFAYCMHIRGVVKCVWIRALLC